MLFLMSQVPLQPLSGDRVTFDPTEVAGFPKALRKERMGLQGYLASLIRKRLSLEPYSRYA